MDVIEVKLRDDLPPAARGPLYRSMREQTDTTENRLRVLFDPELYPLPRADLSLRSKELAGVLAFYIRRAVRYGLLVPTDGEVALSLAEQLDDGYHLELQRMGIVFERQGSGYHIDEDEPGFVVHRFGGNKARKLFHSAMGRFDERRSSRSESESVVVPPSERGILALADAAGEDLLLNVLRASLSMPATRITGPVAAAVITPDPRPHASEPVVRDEESAPRADWPHAFPVPPIESPSKPDEAVRCSVELEPEREGQIDSNDLKPVPPSMDGSPAIAFIPDVLLGSTSITPQYGLIGRAGSHSVALDLNGCNTISLFGVQGFGKSYTLGVIAEMASAQNPGINVLPSPLATVIFHFHKSDAYEPEYVAAAAPNRKASEVDRLLAEFGALPRGLSDVVLLTPEAKVERRRGEYPGIRVELIKFS